MLKCRNCGFENEAEAVFCGNCGKPLSPDAPPIVEDGPLPGPEDGPVKPDGPADGPEVSGPGETTTGEGTIKCPQCGRENAASRVICWFDAVKLRPDPEPVVIKDDDAEAARRRRRRMLLIAGGIVVAILLVIGLAIALAGGGGSRATPTPIPSPPSTATPSPTATTGPTASATAGPPTGRIVFSRCTNSGCVTALINPDGSGYEELDTGASATDPAFSHDGTRVIHVLPDGLFIWDLRQDRQARHSTNQQGLLGDVSPAWSWNDQQLAWGGSRRRDDGNDGDRELRFDASLDGSTLSVALDTNRTDDHDPAFSPDGRYIYWVRGADNERELWRIDIETRERERLTTNTANDVDPAVSPNGQRLAFVSNAEGGNFDLWLMDLRDDSFEVERLLELPGNQHDPEWSPDGRFLVFHSSIEGQEDLFIIEVDAGGEPVRLTSTPENDRWASWSVALP